MYTCAFGRCFYPKRLALHCIQGTYQWIFMSGCKYCAWLLCSGRGARLFYSASFFSPGRTELAVLIAFFISRRSLWATDPSHRDLTAQELVGHWLLVRLFSVQSWCLIVKMSLNQPSARYDAGIGPRRICQHRFGLKLKRLLHCYKNKIYFKWILFFWTFGNILF